VFITENVINKFRKMRTSVMDYVTQISPTHDILVNVHCTLSLTWVNFFPALSIETLPLEFRIHMS
jgi:hypothetical protein